MKTLSQPLLFAALCLVTPFFAAAEYGQSAAEMEAQAAARSAFSASEVKAPNLTSGQKKEGKAPAAKVAAKDGAAAQPAAPAPATEAAAAPPPPANAPAQPAESGTPAPPDAKGGSAADNAAGKAAMGATDGDLVSIGEGTEGDSAAGEGTSTQSDPLMNLILAAVAAYLFYLWLQDYRAQRNGTRNPNAFPGAFPVSAKAVAIAVVGALVILAAETGGEIVLGISGEQSTMTVLMLLSVTAAAFFEELIFRGYLVVSNRGRALLLGSILGFSVIFALAHPFLWEMTTPEGVPGWQFWNAEWSFTLTVKGWFSTAFVLFNSLWFYAMRFNPLNPQRSLIPCIAAHLATNWGVFAVKLAQGHVSGLW